MQGYSGQTVPYAYSNSLGLGGPWWDRITVSLCREAHPFLFTNYNYKLWALYKNTYLGNLKDKQKQVDCEEVLNVEK